MEDYLDIKRESYSCWYWLSWEPNFPINHFLIEPDIPGLDRNQPVIILGIHNDFIEKSKIFPLPDNAPIIYDKMGLFGFVKFFGDIRGNFGFDDALLNNGRKENFTEIIIPLPEKTKKECDNCSGVGWDEWSEDECLACEGTGKRNQYDWQKAFAVVASLEMFFRFEDLSSRRTSSMLYQLMTISTYISKEDNYRLSVSIGGTISVRLRNWFAKLGDRSIDEAVGAMKIAYDRMMGLKAYHDDYIRAFVRQNGWFSIDCPGDRTGIYPLSKQDTGGYDFGDHNVDTPFQFLTILAGLAALHDKARADGA